MSAPGCGIATATAELALICTPWAGFDPDGGMQDQQRVRWIPGAGVSYHVGVDGLSLPLVALTCVLFLAVAVYSLRETRRVRAYVCLFLFLQSVSIGLFVALDLILFFVFFDLSIVGMFFLIAGWGHGERGRAAALKFFLYTFVGSLALLLGFIGLYLAATPHTFDIVELTRINPLAGRGLYAGLVLLAIGIGLAVKTPMVPFHTWLPPAHTEAPAAGSAILAGVLAEDGYLRVRPHRHAAAARLLAPLRPGHRHRRRRLHRLRGTGRPGADRLQTHDRLHIREPHGLHHPGRRRRGNPGRHRHPGPPARRDRARSPRWSATA